MGSRVLLSQDLSASKFSMIILDTIHSGPEARHTPPPAQVSAATAVAAPAPSSARHPRGPRWEAPVAGSREPGSANSSAGTVAGRESTGRQELPVPGPRPGLKQQRFARALPLPSTQANLLGSGGRHAPRSGFLSASQPGGVGNAEQAKVKKAKTKGSSMGTIRGVFPAPSTPKKMAACR